MDGWKCPVCGRGVAPTKETCDHGGQGAAPYLPGLPMWQPYYPYQVPYAPNPFESPWCVTSTTTANAAGFQITPNG